MRRERVRRGVVALDLSNSSLAEAVRMLDNSGSKLVFAFWFSEARAIDTRPGLT
jgi:hypothetical protein